MKKNVKKAVVRVADIVGLAVVCMAAYYGLSMFALQNDLKFLSNGMPYAVIAIVCSLFAMRSAKKARETVVIPSYYCYNKGQRQCGASDRYKVQVGDARGNHT